MESNWRPTSGFRSSEGSRGTSSSCPIAQPVTLSGQLGIHQPSRTLKLGTPFRAAFIPVVLEASCGPCGVFSPAFPLFVMGPEDCFDLIAQVLYVPEFVIRAFVTA